MTTQHEIKQTAQQLQIDERRKEVIILAAQGLTETEIAGRLGVDNTTISKDIKDLKMISQQFIYDVSKSDFTFYYRQCLELVKFVLRKQVELVDRPKPLEEHDFRRVKSCYAQA